MPPSIEYVGSNEENIKHDFKFTKLEILEATQFEVPVLKYRDNGLHYELIIVSRVRT
jgi:hypothetical protein